MQPSISPIIASLTAPPIPLVQNSAQRYDGSLGPLIDLSQAVPGYPADLRLLDALADAGGRSDLLGYGPIPGEDALRAPYARHVSEVYGAPILAEETHITAGCNQAFVAASLCVAASGDALLLVSPFYFNHDTTLSMLGINTATVDAVEATHFIPRIDDIRAALRPNIRAIACVTPNNPTGAVYDADFMGQLFDLCVEAGLWLLVDETYRDFLPSEQQTPHDLFQRDNWRDHLISLYSFSKSFCVPGHRLGAITAGPVVIEAVAKVMDNLQICAPRPVQIAVGGLIEPLADWREGNRVEITGRRVAMEQVIADLDGWEITSIGAYFAYVAHPFEGRSSIDVAAYLAQHRGVSCLPGAFFGEGQDRFLRFAFANATVEDLQKLTDRLALDALQEFTTIG